MRAGGRNELLTFEHEETIPSLDQVSDRKYTPSAYNDINDLTRRDVI